MAWRIDKRAYLVEVRFALGAAAGGPFSNPSLMLVNAESHATAADSVLPMAHAVESVTVRTVGLPYTFEPAMREIVKEEED